MVGQLTINEGHYGVCIIDVSFTAQRYLFCKYFDFFDVKYWNSLTKCHKISILLVLLYSLPDFKWTLMINKHKNKKSINSIGIKENFINFVIVICHAENLVKGKSWWC